MKSIRDLAPRIFGFLVPLGVLILVTRPINAGTLEIGIDGLRSDEGVIYVLVYDDAGAFARLDSAGIARFVELAPRKAGTRHTFMNMAPGQYAVVVHHDENGNALMDEKGGLPSEGFAYSNNVGADRPPSFTEAGLDIDGRTKAVTLHMIYPQ